MKSMGNGIYKRAIHEGLWEEPAGDYFRVFVSGHIKKRDRYPWKFRLNEIFWPQSSKYDPQKEAKFLIKKGYYGENAGLTQEKLAEYLENVFSENHEYFFRGKFTDTVDKYWSFMNGIAQFTTMVGGAPPLTILENIAEDTAETLILKKPIFDMLKNDETESHRYAGALNREIASFVPFLGLCLDMKNYYTNMARSIIANKAERKMIEEGILTPRTKV